MRTSRIAFATFFSVTFVALFASTAVAQQGFVSDATASRAGLKVAWSTQAEISPKSELVDWELIVDEDNATTYFVIEYGKRKEVIAENDISPFGKPYGIEGAKKAAQYRKEDIQFALNNDGKKDVEIKISSYTLPRSTLFVLGARGQVISLDADTGATRWIQQVGDSSLPKRWAGCGQKVSRRCQWIKGILPGFRIRSESFGNVDAKMASMPHRHAQIRTSSYLW